MNSLIAKVFIFLVEVASVLVFLLVMLSGAILVVRGEVLTGLAIAVGGTVVVAVVFGFGAILIEMHKNIAAMRQALESGKADLRSSGYSTPASGPRAEPSFPPTAPATMEPQRSATGQSSKEFIEAEYARYRDRINPGVDVRFWSQKEDLLIDFYIKGLRAAGFAVEATGGAGGKWRLVNEATKTTLFVQDLFELSRYFERYAS